MKLVQILARDLKEWPEGAEYIVQDHDGECWPSDELEDQPPVLVDNTCWGSSLLGTDNICLEIAEDFRTAIVTKEQWEEERAKLGKEHYSAFPKPGERCKVRADLDGSTKWVLCYIVAWMTRVFVFTLYLISYRIRPGCRMTEHQVQTTLLHCLRKRKKS